MICNPMLQTNPFEAAMTQWQKLWLQGLSAIQPQAPAKQAMPAPADMFSQFQAMQNMWLQSTGMGAMVQPQGQSVPLQAPLNAPKITVTTIELGDMRPYFEMASNMMQAWQPMLNSWGRR